MYVFRMKREGFARIDSIFEVSNKVRFKKTRKAPKIPDRHK